MSLNVIKLNVILLDVAERGHKMNSNLKRNISLFVMIAGLSACVTINIYFPAAAAEKAADKIIDDVWQLKDAAQIPIEKQSDPSAKPAESPAK